MKEVAIIGIQGVPANYGGFESLVENIIGDNQSADVHYTIYCSRPDMVRFGLPKEYKGCRLRYLPLHANGMQSIPYDMLAMIGSVRGYDTLLILGTSGCLLLPVIKRLTHSKIVVNIDGLEHRRDKWGRLARTVLRASEASAVRWAHQVISDNEAIRRYVTTTYSRDSAMIAYGGDHALRPLSEERLREILDSYGLRDGGYAVSVCRIEPENNSHLILEAFASQLDQTRMPLVFIGNWHHSPYAHQLHEKYAGRPGITLLDSIYDLDTLYALRSRAGLYVHGHSAGGTNPSLVEAMWMGRPIAAFDVDYNRESTGGRAAYFKSADELVNLLRHAGELDGQPLRDLAEERYRWATIARQYEELY